MATELVTAQQFDNQQIDIMRRTVASGISNDEFALFLQVCAGRNLNPFNKEVYAIKRGQTMTIQVSIDGLRLIAERSGKYKGQLGPFFAGEDGIWKEEWLSSKPPVAAKVGVVREGFDQPIWSMARHAAYAQKSPIWDKMPDLMLSKCAESLALRRAFPAEMGGLYTHEEMGQAPDTSAPPAAIVEEKKPVNPNSERLERLFMMGQSTNMWTNRQQFLQYMSRVLDQPITRVNVGQLSDDLLTIVEDAMLEPDVVKEAAQPETQQTNDKKEEVKTMTTEEMIERAKQFRITVEPQEHQGHDGTFTLYRIQYKAGPMTGMTTIAERDLLRTLKRSANEMAKAYPEMAELLPFA